MVNLGQPVAGPMKLVDVALPGISGTLDLARLDVDNPFNLPSQPHEAPRQRWDLFQSTGRVPLQVCKAPCVVN